ncbi:hydroxymethylbilane synthase, partial [Lactobacillus sp. XV13L]|nr:hydroxymethylbilane synthase [Lactobacillus sp. XV13L]
MVGSRQSKLALCQTSLVIQQLQKYFPDTVFKIKNIRTTGDNNLKDSLTKIGGKGVFIQEIEQELEDETIDLAVHSLKDVTPNLPKGLTLGAIPKRASAFDCLIGKHKYCLL